MRRRGFLHGIGAAGIAFGLANRAAAATRGARGPRSTGRRPSAVAELSAVGAALGFSVTRFEGSHATETAAAPFPLAESEGVSKLALDGATLSCRTRVGALRARPEAARVAPKTPAASNKSAILPGAATLTADGLDSYDVEVQFRLVKGRLSNARLALTLTLDAWTRDAYLLIPGAVYGGNRFASRHVAYPPLATEPSDIGPHVPPIISDIPRLNNQPGESRIALTAAEAAAPMIGARVVGGGAGPMADRGFVLMADPTTAWGLIDLTAVENSERSSATLSVGTPGVRPDVRYELCNNRVPSTDHGADFQLGETVTLRVRLLSFACPDVQTLFDRGYDARREAGAPAKRRHEVPLSVARQAVEQRLVGDQWAEAVGIFTMRAPTIISPAALAAPPSPQLESTFRTGADGAMAVAAPMMATLGTEARRRGAAVLDFQLSGQSSSGFFHAASNGVSWWDEGEGPPVGRGAAEIRPPRGRRWSHVGRNAEALYLGCKQVLFLQRQDPAYQMPERWRIGLGRSAGALVRLWGRHQQLGQYVSCETGDIVVGGSTAGALVPAALLLANKVMATDTYLPCALAAAEAFHARFVRAGLTIGGAPAALQSPDSRSAAGLLESFVALGEVTGEGAWFDKAADAAHQLATWVISWNVPLPEKSTLGRLEVNTTGAVLVSAQDKWAQPGFAGLSGDALFRLYRATGRVSYLELLRETIHNSSGYVDLEDRRPEVDSKAGWVAGRIPIGDSMGQPGEVSPGTPSGAAQATCLMAATEVPSIYVQPDTGFVFPFDHVEARLESRTSAGITVSVHNPTRFEAEFHFYAENDAERSRPLPLFPLWGARALTLGPGATESVAFPPSER